MGRSTLFFVIYTLAKPWLIPRSHAQCFFMLTALIQLSLSFKRLLHRSCHGNSSPFMLVVKSYSRKAQIRDNYMLMQNTWNISLLIVVATREFMHLSLLSCHSLLFSLASSTLVQAGFLFSNIMNLRGMGIYALYFNMVSSPLYY